MMSESRLSKFAEDILKAAALFALSIYLGDRGAFHLNCSQKVSVPGLIALFSASLGLFTLAIAVVGKWLFQMAPWAFGGPSWWEKMLYMLLLASVLVFGYPAARILSNPVNTGSSGSAYNCSEQSDATEV